MTALRLAAALSFALLLCGCNELNPPKPRPHTVVWKAVGTWSGYGSAQTGSFDINIFHWRVHWVAAAGKRGDPAKGQFVLTVNSAISGRPLEEIVRHGGPGEGYADVDDDPRLYHLVIDSNDLDWTVTVEEPIDVGGNQ